MERSGAGLVGRGKHPMTDLLPLAVALGAFLALAALPFALDRFAAWRHRRAAEKRTHLETRGPTRRHRR